MDRMTPLDDIFITLEHDELPLHIGSLLIFDGPMPSYQQVLDLMAARLERRAVAVSSLCIAAAVPPTTALRWIRTMTEAGLFMREDDRDDGRRVYVVLSDRAAEGLNDYFAAIQKVGQKAGGMPV